MINSATKVDVVEWSKLPWIHLNIPDIQLDGFTNMNFKYSKLFCIFTSVLLAGCFSSTGFAQEQGGAGGGGFTGGDTNNQGGFGNDLGGGFTGGTNQGGGNTGGGIGGLSDSVSADDFDPTNQVQIQPPEDERRLVPFIGPASDSLFNFFEGVGSVTGGGGTGFGSNIGGGGGFGGGQLGGGQFGGQLGGLLGGQFGAQFGGQGNGFTITRRSIRAPLTPAFTSPVVTGAQVSARFTDRLIRIPSIQRLGGTQDVRVTVSDDTAVISGTVSSLEARDKVERMARMEPGIYRVVNQLQVRQ